jgi:hypothetical protein
MVFNRTHEKGGGGRLSSGRTAAEKGTSSTTLVLQQ